MVDAKADLSAGEMVGAKVELLVGNLAVQSVV